MLADSADVAVIGSGPAGLMAARTAARSGASVLLAEARERAGGRLGLQVQPLQGPHSMYRGQTGVDLCRTLVEDAVGAGVRLMLRSAVTGIARTPSAFFRLALGGAAAVETKAVVIANGSHEAAPAFPGSGLPGVLASAEAQTSMNVNGVVPGRHVLVVGLDNAGLLVAANLLAVGAEVVAVLDESPSIPGRDVNVGPLSAADVPLLTSSRVIEVIGIGRVEQVVIARVGPDGTVVRRSERTFEADAVCLAGQRTPDTGLAVSAGCPILTHQALGGPVPAHDRAQATPFGGLIVCGDAAGVENGAVSLESGRLAGITAAGHAGFRHAQAAAWSRLARGRLAYLRRGPRGLARREAKAALAAQCEAIRRRL